MERWLVEVEEMMVQSLQDVAVRAVENHPLTPHSQWITQWPSQVVLTVSQIIWTNQVIAALPQGGLQVCSLPLFINVLVKSLGLPVRFTVVYGLIQALIQIDMVLHQQQYLDECEARVQEVVKLVRGQVEHGLRLTMGALIVTYVHGEWAYSAILYLSFHSLFVGLHRPFPHCLFS